MNIDGNIDLSKFKRLRRIGEGGLSIVFKVKEESTGKIFAAKVSTIETRKKKKSLDIILKRELNFMTQLNHPAILKFYGYSQVDFSKKRHPVIVSQYCKNSSLKRVLQSERNMTPFKGWNDTMKLINIFGISAAMAYLHSNKIIHRDLKPDNILESDCFFPLVSDFGLSKKKHSLKSQTTESSTGTKGTPAYIPPEGWEMNEYTKEGDVYAYSLILYEIMTLKKPFENFSEAMICKKVCFDDYRPELDHTIPKCYENLISLCWSKNPSKRPSFEWIMNELKTNEEFVGGNVDREKFRSYIDYIENPDLNKSRIISLFENSLKEEKNEIEEEEEEEEEEENFDSEYNDDYEEDEEEETKIEINKQTQNAKTSKPKSKLLKTRKSRTKKVKVKNSAANKNGNNNNSEGKYNDGEDKYNDSEDNNDNVDARGALFEFGSDKLFKGIMYNLQNQSGGKIDNEICITSSSVRSGGRFNPQNVVLFEEKEKYFVSEDEQNSWLCFDFKNHRILPTHYTIRSCNCNANSFHPKNWIIEASVDSQAWEIIDEQVDCDFLNKPSFSHTFMLYCSSTDKFRFIRMRLTNKNWSNNFILAIESFEIYGRLI